MRRLRGKELSSLYPTPKSFETLRAERNGRLRTRQPRLVALKISISSGIILLVVLLSYHLISRVIKGNLSSYGEVIAGLSLSMLILTFALAIIFYFYLVIQDIASRIFGSSSEVFTTLIFIWFLCAIGLALLSEAHIDSILSIIILLAFCVGMSFLAVERRRRRVVL